METSYVNRVVRSKPPYTINDMLSLKTSSLTTSLLIAAIEGTVISTALASITNDLGGFSEGAWVVNAYALTDSGKHQEKFGLFHLLKQDRISHSLR